MTRKAGMRGGKSVNKRLNRPTKAQRAQAAATKRAMKLRRKVNKKASQMQSSKTSGASIKSQHGSKSRDEERLSPAEFTSCLLKWLSSKFVSSADAFPGRVAACRACSSDTIITFSNGHTEIVFYAQLDACQSVEASRQDIEHYAQFLQHSPRSLILWEQE